MKQVTLCADDYSQTPAISQGILKLLQEKRLSATTCMTNSPYWTVHGPWLKTFVGEVDIGLHLNFTEGNPLTPALSLTDHGQFIALPKLLIQAQLGKLNTQAITTEINAQLDQFITVMGKLPDFVDGHQHIHHFPMIREVLLKTYKDRLQANGRYLRSVAYKNGLLSLSLKKLALQITGAHHFQQQLIKQNIPHNNSFSGVYHFKDDINYRSLFLGFLAEIKNGGLIMCHPGLATDNTATDHDPISKNRAIEFQYLASDSFVKDCQDNDVEIVRYTYLF